MNRFTVGKIWLILFSAHPKLRSLIEHFKFQVRQCHVVMTQARNIGPRHFEGPLNSVAVQRGGPFVSRRTPKIRLLLFSCNFQLSSLLNVSASAQRRRASQRQGISWQCHMILQWYDSRTQWWMISAMLFSANLQSFGILQLLLIWQWRLSWLRLMFDLSLKTTWYTKYTPS